MPRYNSTSKFCDGNGIGYVQWLCFLDASEFQRESAHQMSKIMLRNFARDHRGTAGVEFAIVSTAFITLLMGVTYLAIMLFTNVSLHYAVERGIRLASINPAVSQNAITSEVNGYLTSTGLPAATISYSVSGTPA